jgi:hypothetical protein
MNESFGRQRQSVRVTFEGEPEDAQYYMRWFQRSLENQTYDHVNVTEIHVDKRTISVIIYPAAIND